MHEHPILWKVRTRWAAVGAAVAVVAGAGGIAVSGATNAQLTPSKVNITPCRIMDTRSPGTVGPRSTPLGTNETHTIQVTGKNGSCTIPSDAVAVMMNVTLVSPAQPGFITVFPAGVTRPNASNLNYVAGQAPTPNLVDATLSASGQLSFYASTGPVHLIADIVSFSTSARLSTADIAQQRWDKDRGRPALVEAAGSAPSGVAFDGTSIWVANNESNTISSINPISNTVTATVPVGNGPYGVAFDGTSIWVTNSLDSTVSKINPTTNTLTATVPVGDEPRGVAFDGTNIWVTNLNADTVDKIDPATNTVTATITVGDGPYGVAFDGTNIWVTNSGSNTISKINPTTNTVTATVTVLVGNNPSGIAFDGTSIWVANTLSNTISKISPNAASVGETVPVGNGPFGVAFDGTSIWVTNLFAGTVSKINPITNTVTATVTAGSSPVGVAFDGTNIWVTNSTSRTVAKLRAG